MNKLIISAIKHKNTTRNILYIYSIICHTPYVLAVFGIVNLFTIASLIFIFLYVFLFYDKLLLVLNLRFGHYSTDKKVAKETQNVIDMLIPIYGSIKLTNRCMDLISEIQDNIDNKKLTFSEIESGIYLDSPENMLRRRDEDLL